MDHTVHLEYPQLCIYIWIIIWTMCMYIYIVELDTDHRNLVELLPGFCFDVSVGWPSVPSCSTLGQFMYEKNPIKYHPVLFPWSFVYIYVHIRDSYTHVVFFHIRVSWKNPNYITIVECIHIPMWYFSQSTMDTAWWYTYPSDKWWSDSHLGWFISN